MKGRKPKLALIEGGLSAGRCPPAPGWITAQAKAEWKRAAPQLHSRNLLGPDTLAMLESYCVAIGIVRECEEVMARDGRIVDSDNGSKTHPAFKMQSAAMREARLLAAELGLTPHRRGLRGNDDQPKADVWGADLLA